MNETLKRLLVLQHCLVSLVCSTNESRQKVTENVNASCMHPSGPCLAALVGQNRHSFAQKLELHGPFIII